MQENQIVEIESKIKLIHSITSKTKPETDSKFDNNIMGNNNLNSILHKIDDEAGVHYLDMPRTETAKINNKNIKNNLNSNNEEESKKNKLVLNTNINKGSKKNIDLYFLPKRTDANGNPITKGGKQKVTFIDKITNKSFYNIIEIENFKEYNKMNGIKSNNSNKFNSCCVII